MPLQQFDEIIPILQGSHIVNSDGTNRKTPVGNAAFTFRIDEITIWSNDSVARNFIVAVYDGTSDFDIGVVNCPAWDGSSALAPVEVFSALMPAFSTPYLTLAQGQFLSVRAVAAMTSGKQASIVAIGGRLS